MVQGSYPTDWNAARIDPFATADVVASLARGGACAKPAFA